MTEDDVGRDDVVQPSELEAAGDLLENSSSNDTRRIAEDLRVIARKAYRVEVAVVVVAAILATTAAATSAINTFRIRDLSGQNRIGVDRIVDCTTQGQQCYEEQQAKSNLVIADALLQLNEEHLAIECILLKAPPPARTQADVDRCRMVAKVETEKARNALQKQLNDGVRAATTTTTSK